MLDLFIAILFACLCALANRIGGGGFPVPFGRIVGSLIVGVGTGGVAMAFGAPWPLLGYLAVVGGLGFYLWRLFGWSFDEQTGRWDKTKYPAWIQWAGRKCWPVDNPVSNRRRGCLMKGLRGLQDSLPMFLAFAFFAHTWLAFAPWLIFSLQGVVYNFFDELEAHGINPIGYGEWTWGGTGVPAGILLALAATCGGHFA